ncbi:MAG: branched-chain amino acid ABC transporter permease [Rubrivivax sp.]
MEFLGMPLQAWLGQIVLGLINGSFYAILSLGLTLIFGLLNIVNFAHGAVFMVGAFGTWMAMSWFGIGYGPALVLVPLVVGALGSLAERFLIRRIQGMDHLYGLLLTFGMALIIEGVFVAEYGVSGQPYPTPPAFSGAVDMGFMMVPKYRIWVVFASLTVCALAWLAIEKTRLGSMLRAATENAKLVQAFGVNVPLMMTLTYGAGTALAAFAGVLAAPVTQVSPLMGSNLIIVVFAVVVIGGMGSIAGSVATGVGLGVIEGITKVVYPQGSSMVIFVVMAIVLLVRPAGLFGKET